VSDCLGENDCLDANDRERTDDDRERTAGFILSEFLV
jgi:hypothetical protein